MMMHLSGAKVPYKVQLIMGIFDQLNIIRWLHTDDATKGRNKPKLIMETLKDKPKSEVLTFASGEDFTKAREKAVMMCQH